MKICKRCNQEKPLEDFYIQLGMKDGYRNECKLCHNKGTSPFDRAKKAEDTLLKLNCKEFGIDKCSVCDYKNELFAFVGITGRFCKNCALVIIVSDKDVNLLMKIIEFLSPHSTGELSW